MELDTDIRRLTRAELLHHFPSRITPGALGLPSLMRSIIWQVRRGIQSGALPPVRGSLGTFWHLWIEPIVSRLPNDFARRSGTEIILGNAFKELAMKEHLVRYADFKITDTHWENRRIGETRPEILLYADKVGWFRFLRALSDTLGVSVLAVRGMPRAVTSEYTASHISDAIQARYKAPRRVHLLAMVDYDPSGYIGAHAFEAQLNACGLTDTTLTILDWKREFSAREIRANRYPLATGKRHKKRRETWLEDTKGVNGELYGLAVDACPRRTMAALITELIDER